MSNCTVQYNSLAESALLLYQNYPLLYQVLLLLRYSKHDFFSLYNLRKEYLHMNSEIGVLSFV